MEVIEKMVAKYPTLTDRRLDLAWVLATHPDPKFRDPIRALQLAQDATEGPGRGYTRWNVLGVAHFWAGDMKAARSALEQSMKDGHNATAQLFLAMIHWKSGERVKAREFYDRAVHWIDMNAPYGGRFRQFRTEAEELMKHSYEDRSKGSPNPKSP